MKKSSVFLALFLICLAIACAHQEFKRLTLPVEDITSLEIRCGAGSLEIEGSSSTTIDVRAEIIIENTDQKDAQALIRDKMKLSLERDGDKAVLVAGFEETSGLRIFGNRLINLTVGLPRDLDLKVEDGSGNIELSGIRGDIDIDDGSGSIRIGDIGGNAVINDGSGDIELSGIRGDIDIDDGSGEIVVNDGGGFIGIRDGSGSISVTNVVGDVEISDGSGSIRIDGVEKNVTIKDDGSGSVDISGVKGRISKPPK